MSEHDKKAVEANFTNWKAERAAEMTDGDAFERYAVELIFKDADLSDEEISSGIFGGGGDGGVDGLFFFVNSSLIVDEGKAPGSVESATLWVLQCKNKNSFEEVPVQKLESFVRDLFDFSKQIGSMTFYRKTVRDSMEVFRATYESIIGRSFKFSIEFRYITRSDHDPSPQVLARVDNIRLAIRGLISSVAVNFEFWGRKSSLRPFEAHLAK
jgi:hypothetical protein